MGHAIWRSDQGPPSPVLSEGLLLFRAKERQLLARPATFEGSLEGNIYDRVLRRIAKRIFENIEQG